MKKSLLLMTIFCVLASTQAIAFDFNKTLVTFAIWANWKILLMSIMIWKLLDTAGKRVIGNSNAERTETQEKRVQNFRLIIGFTIFFCIYLFASEYKKEIVSIWEKIDELFRQL